MTPARFLGRVYFVGAGPGDPGLLSVRGRELLERADAVLYDSGVDARILSACRPGLDPRRVESTGERRGPEEVAARLVELARRERSVVRLCRGDPLWPDGGADGGEEAKRLAEAGVPFEIVPGVPTGLAGPAYAGVPLVRADVPAATVLVRALDLARGGEVLAGWAGPARGRATVVVTARAPKVGAVSEALRERGWPGETPAACIGWPGQPRQRTTWASLSDLAERVEVAGVVEGPVVVVAGAAAALGPALQWFERRPLFGRRVVVTRSRAQAGELVRALGELGAEPIEFPTLRVVDAPDPAALRAAARSVDRYNWVIFTSANGVARFWAALRKVGRDARAFGRSRVAAIGPGTAAALAARGLQADLVPDEYVAEAVLEALSRAGPWEGCRALLPRALGARDVLPRGLERLGARVDEVAAYATEPDRGDVERLQKELHAGRVDAITFTASSTVRNFVAAVGPEVDGATVAAIGPVTAETARQLGLPVHVEAEEHTIPGLVRALRNHFQRRGGRSE